MTVQAFRNPAYQDLLMGAAVLGVIGVALLAVLPPKQLRIRQYLNGFGLFL